MKLKKLCTIGIVTMITLTGCKADNEEVVKDSSNVETITETIKQESNNEDAKNDTSEESKINPNYSNNEGYFDRYKGHTHLDEIKNKDSSYEEKDIFYFYESDNVTDKFFPNEKILISKELSLEEKLIILCDYLENKLVDIEINIQSNIDDKFAVVIAIEKYPAWGSFTPFARSGKIEETLKQSKFDGKWFEHVEVIYDPGTFGDV